MFSPKITRMRTFTTACIQESIIYTDQFLWIKTQFIEIFKPGMLEYLKIIEEMLLISPMCQSQTFCL